MTDRCILSSAAEYLYGYADRRKAWFPIQDFVAGLRNFPEPAFNGIDTNSQFHARHERGASDARALPEVARQHYTRNLIDKTPLYELVAICWEVGQVSSVHNHRDQNCWMAVPVGKLAVENYKVISQEVEAGSCELCTADTKKCFPATPAPSAQRTRASCGQSQGVQPARGQLARLLTALRYLCGVFAGAGNVWRDPATLHHPVRSAEQVMPSTLWMAKCVPYLVLVGALLSVCACNRKSGQQEGQPLAVDRVMQFQAPSRLRISCTARFQ